MSRPKEGDILCADGSRRYGVFVGKEHPYHEINERGHDYDAVIELNSEGIVDSTPWEKFSSPGPVVVQRFHLEERLRPQWIEFAASHVADDAYKGRESKDFVDDIIRRSHDYADRWLLRL